MNIKNVLLTSIALALGTNNNGIGTGLKNNYFYLKVPGLAF